MHPLLERLKKRQVVSWTLAYAAGASVIYGVLDGPGEPWGITDAVLRIAQVILIAGVFVTAVLAWYHGEQGRQSVSGPELLTIALLLGLTTIAIRLVGGAENGLPPVDEGAGWVGVLGLPGSGSPGSLVRSIAYGHSFDIAPDGGKIVYTGRGIGGSPELWVRSKEALRPEPLLATTDDVSNPSISTDGSRVAFWTRDGGLQSISVSGGPVRSLARDALRQGSSWGSDGFVYYAARDSTIRRVHVEGEGGRSYTLKEAGYMHRWPESLPDGRGLILTVTRQPTEGLPAMMTAMSDSTFVAISTEADQVPVRLFPGTHAKYLDTGHLVYMSLDGVLTATSFDAERGEVTGPHLPLIDDVLFSEGGMFGWYSVSRAGELVYWEDTPQEVAWNDQVVWVDRESGVATPVDEEWFVEAVTTWSSLALSPDASHLAYSVFDRTSLQRVRRLVDGSDWGIDPGVSGDRRARWAQDGATLSFVRTISDTQTLVEASADGSGPVRTLLEASSVGLEQMNEAVLHPGREWVVTRTGSRNGGVDSRTNTDVVAFNLSDGRRLDVATSQATEWTPDLSPDGGWIAYTTNADQFERVIVRPFPAVEEGFYPVSLAGGRQPRWSRRGDELFYIDDDDQLVAARVSFEDGFRVTAREQLFSTQPFMLHNVGWSMYDYDPSGRRFVMFQEGPSPPPVAGRVIVIRDLFGRVESLMAR